MTTELFEELTALNMNELKELCISISIPFPRKQSSRSSTQFKASIIRTILSKYYQLCKYINYTYVKQLGVEGKDGRAFLAQSLLNGETYAVKILKQSKSASQIEQEATLQKQASLYNPQISPRVIEYSGRGKYIVMETMDTTLFSKFKSQHGSLSTKQQKQCIELFRHLDTCGIFHADPNPLNFMFKKSRLYMIDYGFAQVIDSKCILKYGKTPNMKYMVTGLYIKLKNICKETDLSYFEEFIPEKSVVKLFKPKVCNNNSK